MNTTMLEDKKFWGMVGLRLIPIIIFPMLSWWAMANPFVVLGVIMEMNVWALVSFLIIGALLIWLINEALIYLTANYMLYNDHKQPSSRWHFGEIFANFSLTQYAQHLLARFVILLIPIGAIILSFFLGRSLITEEVINELSFIMMQQSGGPAESFDYAFSPEVARRIGLLLLILAVLYIVYLIIAVKFTLTPFVAADDRQRSTGQFIKETFHATKGHFWLVFAKLHIVLFIVQFGIRYALQEVMIGTGEPTTMTHIIYWLGTTIQLLFSIIYPLIITHDFYRHFSREQDFLVDYDQDIITEQPTHE